MANGTPLPPFVCAYQGAKLAGVDEVGRGPLAGPVVTAAVILRRDHAIEGLTDSKLLTAQHREELYEQILENSVTWSIGRCEVEEIDRLNIYQATMVAMERAVQALHVPPEYVLVDGNRCPKWHWRSEAVVQGDGRVEAISAASILAKVTRDREMVALEETYPGFGLAEHKGYGTPRHLEALNRLGITPIHRRSFRPVQEVLSATGLWRAEGGPVRETTYDESAWPQDLFENSR
ncbi:RNase HII [Marinobacter daqiaonensis]|uniref:Ribonuclease HII n=1 Tax=Marinobacter daqiaonensis TaxID=650891 RepID=A0A1I6H8E2_9GAMM|nr:ribonuclease HII [Marinobacter daqiaonensis]SFR50567.1 RNase HII [Marinobacter daqiaonensis]